MEYRKNDRVTVKIEDMGNEGEGIGKADGFTLFVKDAVAGDTVEAKILKVKKNYAYARMEKILIPSPQRVEPACPFYRQCGGCQLQALSYDAQLLFKQRKIRNSLVHIGKFEEAFIDSRMEPIVGSTVEESAAERNADEGNGTEGNSAGGNTSQDLAGGNLSQAAESSQPLHYRNKAQYPVGTDREGNIITGFYAGRTHSIIPNTDCCLGPAENREILEIILDHMKKYNIPAYDEATGQGLVRHILIRKGFASREIMVCLVINRRDRASSGQGAKKARPENGVLKFFPGQEQLIGELTKVAGMTSISVSVNNENTNVIMGEEIHVLWGSSVISDTIRARDMRREGYPFTGQELTFCISPLSFYQVNPAQTEKLYSLALEYAGLTGKETVWDLYCGIGTISLFLAAQAGQVYGVEVVPQAIVDARENARRNGIRNAEFFVGKAEEVLPAFYEKISDGSLAEAGESAGALYHPDVIVVDPPRKGCDAVCLETMLKMRPERIVYVSCDPATLARDLRVLCDGGYEIKRIRGTDMFPETVHVETVVKLEKEIYRFDEDVKYREVNA